MKLFKVLTMMVVLVPGAKADWFGDSFVFKDGKWALPRAMTLVLIDTVNGNKVGDANYLQCVNEEGTDIGSVEIDRSRFVHSRVYCISWYHDIGCDEKDVMGRMTWDMSQQGKRLTCGSYEVILEVHS
jgi:hypothetical protein